jgi:hypothetical protein
MADADADADAYAKARPDGAIVFGNDQQELFNEL